MQTATKEAQQAQVNGTEQTAITETKPTDQALAPVGGVTTITWTQDRIDLIKRQICPAGITNDEFAIFIEQCKRTAMDPLIKEAFCVPRRVKITKPDPRNPHGRGIEEWITKHEFQPAEAGMASRADRFPDYRGIKAAAVHENDTIEIDAEAGTVVHKFNPINAKRGKLVGAWARVYRENRHTPVEWVTLDEYRQLKQNSNEATGQWAGKPETMIVKCARAAAFRRAYPNVFGGLYIEEEMPEERELNPAPNGSSGSGQAEPDTRTKAERMADQVKQKTGSSASTSTVDAQKTPSEPVARFGGDTYKGVPLSKLTVEQLAGLYRLGADSVAKSPTASWANMVSENLKEIEAEQAERALAVRDAMNAAVTEAQIEDAPKEEPAPGFETVATS